MPQSRPVFATKGTPCTCPWDGPQVQPPYCRWRQGGVTMAEAFAQPCRCPCHQQNKEAQTHATD